MLSQLPQMPVYPLWPFQIKQASGCWITDDNNTKYLDMYGGHAVASVGHCHPHLLESIAKQSQQLVFYSNVCDLEIRTKFIKKLMTFMPQQMSSVFLSNSGTEANEHALTLARLKNGRPNIVSIEGGFHGRSALCLSACGIEKYRKLASANGTPLFDKVRFLEFNDISNIEKTIDESCSAVILEPVQGLAGARAFSKQFLEAIKNRCNETQTVLIFDEVQCGSGRSGNYTATETFGIVPNIITMAKGLAGGFPIGATIADETFTTVLDAGSLGSTFGGGPLACAAGLATLEIIENENLLANVKKVSAYLVDKLSGIKGISNVSGHGFLIGLTSKIESQTVILTLREKNNIITGSSTNPYTTRIMPPLTLSLEEAKIFITAIESIF